MSHNDMKNLLNGTIGAIGLLGFALVILGLLLGYL